MFRSKKKEKKESSTASGTSSYQEKSTINQSNNGIVMTRQVSTGSSHIRTFTREERSFSIGHTSSAGSPSSLFKTSSGLSVSVPGSVFFGTRSISNGNFPSIQADATPFNFSTSRTPLTTGSTWTGTGSYPLRSRQTILPISNQSAARNPTIAQSQPVTPLFRSIVPTYVHARPRLGRALIINNIKFAGLKEERQGAEKDSRDMKKILRDMGFEVEHKLDLKGKEISARVKAFSKTDFNHYNISVVVIMTHGNNLVQEGNKVTTVRGGFTQIAGIDNVLLSTDDIIEMFTRGNCHHSLHGKPKIFIFQCCRGDRDQEVRHDAIRIKGQNKEHSDVLIAFSTLPGYLSNRNPKTGTWYIQSICDVFGTHHKDHHVEDMLKIVDAQLGNKHPQYTQTSTYENRGFKQCFLFKTS